MNRQATYGSELTAAQAVLGSLLQDRADTAAETEAYQVAWLQLCRLLYRHAAVLLGADRYPMATYFEEVLGYYAEKVRESSSGRQAWSSADYTVQSLRRVVEHLSVAADILFSHIGPDGGARTSAGIALLAGVNRSDNFAAIADLIVLAVRAVPAGVAAPETIRILSDLAESAARRTHSRSTYLAKLEPAVDVSSNRWPDVTSHADFRSALEAARTWLAQHYAIDLTGQQARHIFGAGLALSNELGFIAVRLRDDVTSELRAKHASSTWRVAYLNTENVVSLEHHDLSAGPAAMAAAERWLRTQLRAGGSWREDVLPPEGRGPKHSGARDRWRETAAEIASSLPDIATMLYHGVREAAARRGLFTLDAQYDGTVLVRDPSWVVGTAQTPAIQRLIGAAREVHPASILLCDLLDVAPYVGLHDTGRTRLGSGLAARPAPAADGSGPTARLLRQLAAAAPAVSSPLPPAAAKLADRARDMDRRRSNRTKVPVQLVHDVVAEVQTLLETVDRLQAEAGELRTATHSASADSTPHPIADTEPEPSTDYLADVDVV